MLFKRIKFYRLMSLDVSELIAFFLSDSTVGDRAGKKIRPQKRLVPVGPERWTKTSTKTEAMAQRNKAGV